MYSLSYGTLPIVRATGGLNDTVTNYDERTGTGTGFKFHDPEPHALYYTVGWAVSTYYDRPAHFKAMVQQAMKCDNSWEKSVGRYEALYTEAIAAKEQYDITHS
jgi:starch synthase